MVQVRVLVGGMGGEFLDLVLGEMHHMRFGVVGRQRAAGCNAHDGEAEWPFLDNRPRGTAMTREEIGVEHTLVLRQVVDEYVTVQFALQG